MKQENEEVPPRLNLLILPSQKKIFPKFPLNFLSEKSTNAELVNINIKYSWYLTLFLKKTYLNVINTVN